MGAKHEAESMEPVFKRLRQAHFGLGTAYQQVELAILLQQRNNFARPADMAVTRSLYGVEYFHMVRKCFGDYGVKNAASEPACQAG